MKSLAMFQKFNKVPGGKHIFSSLVCKMAPYFSSISPMILELNPGFCKVSIKKRRKVTNHIGTVHAIAMCNMAELAAGLMTDASIPPNFRWIPVGMTVVYEKKANTDLIATAQGQEIDWQTSGDVTVPVDVYDTDDLRVFRAQITMRLSPKPVKKSS